MNEILIAHCRARPDGVPSAEIAELFLKFKSPDPRLAHLAVKAILDKDKRFSLGPDALWRVTAPAPVQDSPRLRDLPWAATVVLSHNGRVVHVSIWSVFPRPQPVANEWLIDPATLPADERESLSAVSDTPFHADQTDIVLGRIAENLGAALPVFISSREQALLARQCLYSGDVLSDDYLVMGGLLQAAGAVVPRPINLAGICSSLLVTGMAGSPARENGRMLADCIAEVVARLEQEGIETRAQFEERESRQCAAFDFTGKMFTFDDLAALPCKPGVYGFADPKGETIYVGKATSLRRRIMSYFRQSEESPAKLEQLRTRAHALITHRCGSELESLIFEYRLIKKHAPALNTQTGVNERPGTYKPLPDCVILLPHAEEGKGMSVWFRSGQKILLRPFDADFSAAEGMAGELEGFFFSLKLATAATDFPEQEIAYRWVRRHQDSLVMVPAARMASGAEVLEAMRSSWREIQTAQVS